MILFPFLFTLFLRKIEAKTKTNQIGCDARFSFLVLRVLLRFKAFHYSFNENQIEKRIE